MLVAVGFEETLVAVGEHLHVVPAAALLGGTALYLLAHTAFRWRDVHRFSMPRVTAAAACLALVPVALEVPALATLSLLAAVLVTLIIDERRRFAELRARLRRQLAEA